jgi:hypothetical protein
MDGGVKGDLLPPQDHVLRHCRKNDVLNEPDGRPPYRVYPAAFSEDDPDRVSVTWLEVFGGTPAEQLGRAREAIARGLTLRASHRLARLQVAGVLRAGELADVELSVIHDPVDEPPEKENKGHSLIRGIPPNREDVLNLLANAVMSLELAVA